MPARGSWAACSISIPDPVSRIPSFALSRPHADASESASHIPKLGSAPARLSGRPLGKLACRRSAHLAICHRCQPIGGAVALGRHENWSSVNCLVTLRSIWCVIPMRASSCSIRASLMGHLRCSTIPGKASISLFSFACDTQDSIYAPFNIAESGYPRRDTDPHSLSPVPPDSADPAGPLLLCLGKNVQRFPKRPAIISLSSLAASPKAIREWLWVQPDHGIPGPTICQCMCGVTPSEAAFART